MAAIALLAMILLTRGFLTHSCDVKIVKAITDKLIFGDMFGYMKNKIFLDVWIARKHFCKDCLAGSIKCSWMKVEEDNNQLKIRHFFRTRALSFRGTIESQPWKWMAAQNNGVFIERNIDTDEPEYFLYPLYMNTKAGVVAFHRCTINSDNPWYTTISVLKDNYRDPPLGMTTETWDAVKEAREMIEKWGLHLHQRAGKVIQDPYGCKNGLYSPGL